VILLYLINFLGSSLIISYKNQVINVVHQVPRTKEVMSKYLQKKIFGKKKRGRNRKRERGKMDNGRKRGKKEQGKSNTGQEWHLKMWMS
jgi:hypothetical protein